MFYNAKKFNQDISKWDLSSAIDTISMFQGAGSFNQNLCQWGDGLDPSKNTNDTETITVTTMFGSSGCPTWDDPILTDSIPGPFCVNCKSSANQFGQYDSSTSFLLTTIIGFILASIAMRQ